MKLNNKPTFLNASQNVVGFYNKIFNIRRLINYPRKFICWPSLLPGMWRYPSSKIKRMRNLSLFTNKYVYVLTYDLKSQKYVYVLTYVDVDSAACIFQVDSVPSPSSLCSPCYLIWTEVVSGVSPPLRRVSPHRHHIRGWIQPFAS